jgi:hypothetical protein
MMVLASGRSSPLSITVVAMSTSASPLLNRMMVSSTSFMRPWATKIRAVGHNSVTNRTESSICAILGTYHANKKEFDSNDYQKIMWFRCSYCSAQP